MSREDLKLVVDNESKPTLDQSEVFRVFKSFYSQFRELCRTQGVSTTDPVIAKLFQEAMDLRKDAGRNRRDQLSVEEFVQRFELLYVAVFKALGEYSNVIALRGDFGTRISKIFPKDIKIFAMNTPTDGYENTDYDFPLDLVAMAVIAGKGGALDVKTPYEEAVDVRITDQLAALSRRSRDQVFSLLSGYDRNTVYQVLGMEKLEKVPDKGYLTPLIDLISEVRSRLEKSHFKVEGIIDARNAQGPLRDIIKSEVPSDRPSHLHKV